MFSNTHTFRDLLMPPVALMLFFWVDTGQAPVRSQRCQSVKQKTTKKSLKDASHAIHADTTVQERLLQHLCYCGAFSEFQSWAPQHKFKKIRSPLRGPLQLGSPSFATTNITHLCLVQQRWNALGTINSQYTSRLLINLNRRRDWRVELSINPYDCWRLPNLRRKMMSPNVCPISWNMILCRTYCMQSL